MNAKTSVWLAVAVWLIGISHTAAVGRVIYVDDNVSALSFTDRTPYPKDVATAYEAVMSMERLSDREYDRIVSEYR